MVSVFFVFQVDVHSESSQRWWQFEETAQPSLRYQLFSLDYVTRVSLLMQPDWSGSTAAQALYSDPDKSWKVSRYLKQQTLQVLSSNILNPFAYSNLVIDWYSRNSSVRLIARVSAYIYRAAVDHDWSGCVDVKLFEFMILQCQYTISFENIQQT